ncbi:Ig-like domain-containing protein [Jiangella endophytica]|uniref:Ig-like domain-containing protein n=1 Tax=Jiangella endophytica TaxID=1623398 RepID=UPI000E34E338|nr:Ig-like domain-containing protein [Jiangella endophytica]
MSTMWPEDLDSDAEYDEGELYDSEGDLEWDEGESDEGESEESRDARRRRYQARQLTLARRQAAVRRQAQLRARPSAVRPRPLTAPAPARPAPAVRGAGLDTQLAHDSLRRELALQRRRMNRSEYAAVAGLAVNQLMESFAQPENVYARAALRFAPLLLLAPQRRGRGLESFVADPRVIGGAAVLGIVAVGEWRGKASILANVPSELAANTTQRLSAQIVTPQGKVLERAVTWTSTDDQVAKVERGMVTTGKAGTAILSVSAEGVAVKRFPVIVK